MVLNLEPKGIIQYLIISEALPNHNHQRDKHYKNRGKYANSHQEQYDLGILFISYYDGQGKILMFFFLP